jgi:adenylyl cyclase-associated protein
LTSNPSFGQAHLSTDPLATASGLDQTAPEHINEFAAIIDNVVGNYVERSERVGGPVFEQAQQVLRGFREQQAFLLLASQAKQPEDRLLAKLLEPTNHAIVAVNSIRDENRSSTFYNHLSTVAEGIVVLAWVTLPAKPYKHVDDSRESAQYWGNRVLKEYKEKSVTTRLICTIVANVIVGTNHTWNGRNPIIRYSRHSINMLRIDS